MVDVRLIVSQLPHLRRFARAITGNQRRGDALVQGVLQAMASRHRLPGPPDLRVELYKLLIELSNGPCAQVLASLGSDEPSAGGPERSLEAISMLSRQAFLLVTMEGFPPRVAAEILSVSEPELQCIMERAQQEISDQVATDILIIEDEILIAHDIQRVVESLGHSVIGRAKTRKEAVAYSKIRRPGLVLADIQLADGSSGLEAVNEILQNGELSTVFITAFPERLLTGMRPEPTYLIAKPFDVAELKAVISQVLFFQTKACLAAPANDHCRSPIIDSSLLMGRC